MIPKLLLSGCWNLVQSQYFLHLTQNVKINFEARGWHSRKWVLLNSTKYLLCFYIILFNMILWTIFLFLFSGVSVRQMPPAKHLEKLYWDHVIYGVINSLFDLFSGFSLLWSCIRVFTDGCPLWTPPLFYIRSGIWAVSFKVLSC